MEISDDKIFLFTSKQELLIYSMVGETILDTVLLQPKLYPDGQVEAYLNNSLHSIFHFKNTIYSLGSNPSDIYKFDLQNREISRQRIKLGERGLHDILSTSNDHMIVSFLDPPRNTVHLFSVDFPNLKPRKLAQVTPTAGKNTFATFEFRDSLYLLETLKEGLWSIKDEKVSLVQENFFLDSILHKGELKGVRELSEYTGLAPWLRNQHHPDILISVLQIKEDLAYFLVKKLNRTEPKAPEFDLILYRLSGKDLESKHLEGFQFAKLDTETKTFLGFTYENWAIAISNLDSLVGSN
ncbi:hypothetical protein LZF95_22500 [Algoriphagus sp. AGSA1]|uniref:hypothetical protein n=1 Tax=Algoriphagus sp. AGSA1 TaxID=2907213 RepID=UPI001F485C3A|nr:hypothetical protein [Algoriphagus sp. AGSA1]MCE7057469.1 hypothetical protein [Algoriphagus sp. AGSA1]